MSLRDEAPSEFDSRQQPSELPVPYVSPWIEFGRNLRALIADLRLNIQAIWRRNREGDLSVPAFWPSTFTSLFWPLILVLLLLLSFAGLRWLQSDGGVEQRPVANAIPQPVAQPLPWVNPDSVLTSEPESKPESDVAPDTDLFLGPSAPELAPPPKPTLVLDPLLELFLDGSASEGVLIAASPQPEQNRLVLELSEQWFLLTPERREALASIWFDRAADLDYQTLQLIDSRNNLLGRSARVGTGMILFAAAPQE